MKSITVKTATMVMEMVAAGMTEMEGADGMGLFAYFYINPPVSFLPQIPTGKFRRIYGTRELNTLM